MTEPTDNDLDVLLAEQWPAFATSGHRSLQGMRAAMRAAIAKWGTLRADKIVIPTDTMEQEFQKHYRRGYEAGLRAQPAPAASVLEDAARLLESQHTWLTNVAAANLVRSVAARKQGANHD